MFSSSYYFSACGNREHLGNFQSKSVNSAVNWVSDTLSSCPNWKGKKGLFWKGAIMKPRGTTLQDYNLVDIAHEKVSPFVKFEIIQSRLCFLLDPLTNKHCRTWSFIINLWIDSRTCQEWMNNTFVNKAKV